MYKSRQSKVLDMLYRIGSLVNTQYYEYTHKDAEELDRQ